MERNAARAMKHSGRACPQIASVELVPWSVRSRTTTGGPRLPWPVSYDHRIQISPRSFANDIVKSINGTSGYFRHLQSDSSARKIPSLVSTSMRSMSDVCPFIPVSATSYSFAREGPRASATSTHRTLLQPEIKARQRARQQGRRRVDVGSNAARCPCSFPHSRAVSIKSSVRTSRFVGTASSS
jgi:hypothetical protein